MLYKKELWYRVQNPVAFFITIITISAALTWNSDMWDHDSLIELPFGVLLQIDRQHGRSSLRCRGKGRNGLRTHGISGPVRGIWYHSTGADRSMPRETKITLLAKPSNLTVHSRVF
jgi:hypothetical protein